MRGVQGHGRGPRLVAVCAGRGRLSLVGRCALLQATGGRRGAGGQRVSVCARQVGCVCTAVCTADLRPRGPLPTRSGCESERAAGESTSLVPAAATAVCRGLRCKDLPRRQTWPWSVCSACGGSHSLQPHQLGRAAACGWRRRRQQRAHRLAVCPRHIQPGRVFQAQFHRRPRVRTHGKVQDEPAVGGGGASHPLGHARAAHRP
mmetsp:Transcript_39367/g.93152  ORF Transcript_39367/g.93152 Transcript_39367/m.93152 type:complete len:204 (-) Transcript_39367:1808-2419(-)